MGKVKGRPKKKPSEMSAGVCITLYPHQIKLLAKLGKGNKSKGAREVIERYLEYESRN